MTPESEKREQSPAELLDELEGVARDLIRDWPAQRHVCRLIIGLIVVVRKMDKASYEAEEARRASTQSYGLPK